jgi:acetyltransferase-like isoleucine patch superfamily enzyme
MRKKGARLTAFRRLAAKLSYAARLVRYDLFVGERTGLVALNPGIGFGLDVAIELGARVYLGRNGIFQGTGSVAVGAGTYIGNFFNFNARSRISVGENCMLANFVSVVDNNHGSACGADMRNQPIVADPITIERNCWLGEKCTILAGVHIGEGAIVAAGAVVTADVPANALVGGIPARLIRFRSNGEELAPPSYSLSRT